MGMNSCQSANFKVQATFSEEVKLSDFDILAHVAAEEILIILVSPKTQFEMINIARDLYNRSLKLTHDSQRCIPFIYHDSD